MLHDAEVMTAATTESAREPAPTREAVEKSAAQTAVVALAAQMVRGEALRWLTSERVTTLGQQVAASIDRYQPLRRER